VQAYAFDAVGVAFTASQRRFTDLVGWLADEQAVAVTHAELEDRLHSDGLALLRQLLQDSLDLRAVRECRLGEVLDGGGGVRAVAENGRERLLATRFGEVVVARIAYRTPGLPDLHPPTQG
jgi:hypothetical protein